MPNVRAGRKKWHHPTTQMSAPAPSLPAPRPAAEQPPEAGAVRVASFALIAAVALPVLLLGGASPWARAAVGAAALVAAGAALLAERGAGRALQLPALALAFVLGAALCALQLLPLPLAVLEVLSPATAQVARVSLGADARAAPISLDAAATWGALALHLCWAALLYAGGVVSRDAQARQRVLTGVALLGVAVSVIGYAHALLGLDNLFGLRLFTHARPAFVTPFGNANHLAGLLILSTTLCLGLFLSAERGLGELRPRRLVFGLGYALGGVAILLSLSRGGMLAFLLSQLMVATLVLGHRARSAGGRLRRGAWAALGLAAVACVGAYVGYDQLAAEWDSAGGGVAQKSVAWPAMASAAREFSALGMGRGAFELGYAGRQTERLFMTFTHPENVALQLWAELGALGAAAFVLAVGWGLSRLRRKGRSTTLDLAVAAGCAGVLLHNLADFSLELPAVMAAVVVALSTLARREDRAEPSASASDRRWAIPIALAAAAGIAVGLAHAQRSLGRDEAQLAALIAGGAPAHQLAAEVQAALGRHMGAHSLHALAGAGLAATDPARALQAFGKALSLKPGDGYAHLGAARALAALGRRGQALLHLRLADEAGVEGALVEGVALARTPGDLRVLTGHRLTKVMPIAELAARAGKGAQARTLVEAVLAAGPADPLAGPLWLHAARLRLSEGELAEAQQALDRIRGGVPEDRVIAARADVLRASGQRREALELLTAEAARAPRSAELAWTLAAHLTAEGEYARARSVLGAARVRARGRDAKVSLLIEEARLHELEQRHASALDLYRTAIRLAPARPDLHYAMARILERLGRDQDAVTHWREGLRLDRSSSAEAARRQLSALEARLGAR